MYCKKLRSHNGRHIKENNTADWYGVSAWIKQGSKMIEKDKEVSTVMFRTVRMIEGYTVTVTTMVAASLEEE